MTQRGKKSKVGGEIVQAKLDREYSTTLTHSPRDRDRILRTVVTSIPIFVVVLDERGSFGTQKE